MVGAGDLLTRHLVEAERQALGAAAGIDEEDRRAVGAHELEELGVDRRPDRAARGLGAAEEGVEVGRGGGVGLDHRLDGDVDAQVEGLAHAGVDDLARPPRADHEARDLLERALRGAQPDALDVASGLGGQPLEGEGQVRPPLGRGDGMDLVDDAPLGAREHLLGAARQHQIQRLRRGDEDVRRLAEHRLAFALGRVAGPERDAQVGADSAQGSTQVAFDVVGQRLQRRHVDQPRAALAGLRLGHEAVDRPQKSGECLTRARGRRDEDVLAGGDRGPRLGLGRRRLGERPFEPLANAG